MQAVDVEWHHLAISWNGTILCVYVGGKEESCQPFTGESRMTGTLTYLHAIQLLKPQLTNAYHLKYYVNDDSINIRGKSILVELVHDTKLAVIYV